MYRHANFSRFLLTAICLYRLTVFAQETYDLPAMAVLGSKEAIKLQVGSVAYISKEELQMQHDTNVNRILQRVPGVYVREEDGYGNFLNVSIRGADGTRSEKLTLMEDGILTAPAPYSAPAAYYAPNAARMSGIEVLKGSSQVRFGPQTTGGVLNYISTPIPEERETRVRVQAEEDSTFSGHVSSGETVENATGRFGYLVELYGMRSDGYRDIQKSGQDAGFERVEPMIKLSWEPNTSMPQRFEFKYGATSFDANESYLGLTEADADATPYARYAASQFDNIDTTQLRSYLNWSFHPAERTEVESTLYYSTFKRNFQRTVCRKWMYSAETVPAISSPSAKVFPAKKRIVCRKLLPLRYTLKTKSGTAHYC